MEAVTTEHALDLLADALERPPAERRDFVARACAGNETLCAEVQALLAHESGAREFLEKPAFTLEDVEPADVSGELKPGDVLGDCTVVRLLGEGGMGEVYLADDNRLERRVAVKLLKCHLGSEDVLRRFRHERKMLAGLTHPNIARLYGGAVTPAGRPYLVMEYVDGERLDRYCDLLGLDVTGRLAIFRKVCAAVAYAHQHLVVHRDLKPANILVTPEGEPKLLDFGIAKFLDPDTSHGVAPTVTMFGALTPEYASPQQLKGEAVTTSTDIYSLGVLL